MKKIKVYASTNKVGSECSRIIEVEDNINEEELEDMVVEVANEMINIWHEVVK